MTTPHDLMGKLLDYIVEQGRDIDPMVFNLSTIRTEFKRFPQELAGLPGVEFDVKITGDHLWLQVQRLEAKRSPRLPGAVLRPYVVVDDNPSGVPPREHEIALAHIHSTEIEQMGQEEADGRDAVRRHEVSRIVAEHVPVWLAWAEGEKPRRRTIELYGDLFALKLRLEAEETARPSELVWGIGIAAWKFPWMVENGKVSQIDFQYPLLTQAVEIDFDDQTHTIAVRPRSVDPRLEFDAFGACLLPGAADVERSAKQLFGNAPDSSMSPFDLASFEPVLKLVAGSLNDKGRYLADHEGLPSPAEDLLVTSGCVILSRPRPNNILNEDIRRLKERLQEGDPIPDGPVGLVTPPSDEVVRFRPISFRGLSGRSSAAGEPRELFFPLPYNLEQETIIEQLERSAGVAVQGPPGTGKTHTIANIICHYLATGRKVLVTSKGEPALAVLQAKIPENVRPLTVALLCGDKEGMRQFQSSIEAIIHNLTHLNPAVVTREIEVCKSAIEQAHTELVGIDRRIGEIAAAQLSEVNVDGVRMRAQKMAELVIAGLEQHGWFDDILTLSPEHTPPISAEEASSLRESRRRLRKDLAYVSCRLPSSHSLPSPSDIGRLHDVLVGMHEIDDAEREGELLPLRAVTPQVLDDARTMLEAIEEVSGIVSELEQSDRPWVFELRRKCRRSDFTSEREALEALFDEIDEIVRSRAEFMKRPVAASREALDHPKGREAIDRAAASGKPFGLFSMGAGEIKMQVNAIRVAGLPPASPEDWQHVGGYARLHTKVKSFCVRWNQFAAILSVPDIDGGVENLREIERTALAARQAHRLGTLHDMRLPEMAGKVFVNTPTRDLSEGSEGLERVRGYLRRHLTRAELALAATQLASLEEKLTGTTGLVADDLRRFVSAELGDGNVPTERAVARYAGLIGELRRIEGLSHDILVVQARALRLEEAGAQRLAARVKTQVLASSGEDHVLPVTWREAWNWARIRNHLDSIEAREELVGLASRRRDLERGLAGLYERLVSKSAWLSTKENASARVLSALETYRTAIRKIGHGTGPNATRHRRDAQKAMTDAQGAVPCWVMSHMKVSETLPSLLGSFDLVIVDEASQSNLWALPAVLRGKKILVVGDDRQVSPDGGFIAAVKIQELKDRFLSDQPYAAVLTPEKSLYDIASTVFAAQKVMLREHFRCVPPIIAYSNRTFYQNFIQPLRIPKLSERIDPPLVDVFVPDGYRDRNNVNAFEAKAISAEIEAILADRLFAGRTIGVVSLLGPDQARYIDTLVRSRCDAAELMRRRFECGDARVFQGSERDIMFLSMVADSKAHKALSGNMFEQRFNVAASRARDRMYLVRSVKLEELSPADLRVSLVEHFSKPMDAGEETKSLIGKCESGFEKQVYTELFNRGYRVIPQVASGSFRIDMVVEGANDNRLAIECDGDDFHGPDRWPADMARQRILERAGWVFWRCFASTWSMCKNEVLKELLDRMNAMGIEPLGAIEHTPSLVEYRAWRPKPEDSPGADAASQMLEEEIASRQSARASGEEDPVGGR